MGGPERIVHRILGTSKPDATVEIGDFVANMGGIISNPAHGFSEKAATSPPIPKATAESPPITPMQDRALSRKSEGRASTMLTRNIKDDDVLTARKRLLGS